MKEFTFYENVDNNFLENYNVTIKQRWEKVRYRISIESFWLVGKSVRGMMKTHPGAVPSKSDE